MPAVTVNDLNNAQLDVNTIAAMATSSAATVTDRLGNTKSTLSGLIADLNASVAITQTSINRAAAEAAGNTASALANLWPDTTTGIANTAEGRFFSTPSPDPAWSAVIYRKVSGAAVDTQIRSAGGQAITQGIYPATDGTDSLNLNATTMIHPDAVAMTGRLSGFSVFMNSTDSGACIAYLLFRNESGNWDVAASKEVTLLSGVENRLNWYPDVTAGQYYFALYTTTGGLRYSSAAGKTLRYISGKPTANTPTTGTSDNVGLRFGWKIEGGLLGRVSKVETDTAVLQPSEVIFGQYPAAYLGNVLVAGYTGFNLVPLIAGLPLSDVSVWVEKPTAGRLLLISKNADASINYVDSVAISCAAGLNTFDQWLPTPGTGYYLAVYLEISGLSYAGNGGTGGGYCLGLPGVNTATGTVGPMMRFSIGFRQSGGSKRSGVLEKNSSGLRVGTGQGLLSLADSRAVTDSTTLFATAYAQHPAPYVPLGTYAVTSLPNKGDRFYGPGKIEVNGVRYPLPLQPRDSGLLLTARARHARAIADGSALILLGDSVSAHFNASVLSRHWFSRYERWVNDIAAPAGEVSTVIVRNDEGNTGETATFYGLTLSGNSNGTRGPVGKSVILAAGGYIEFTGSFAWVDAFYQQEAGAGSLAFSFNGASAYKTVAAAGATALDKFSGPSPTGQADSGTYRITATGGPVEITGIVRHAALIATAGTPNRLNCMRVAYGGYQTTSFTDARIDALLAQANAFGGTNHQVYLGLGTNDMLFGASPSAYETNLTRIITRLQAGGVQRIWSLSPIRMNYGQWNTYLLNGNKFDQYVASLAKVCVANNIPLLRFDAVDFQGLGLLSSDGLHPNDAGFDLMLDMIARSDAA